MTAPKKPSFLARQWAAFKFVLTTVLPCILRTGRRPVLLSRWSGMGDIICTFPAAGELRKRHPKAPFLFNCLPDFAPVVKMSGVADQITACVHAEVAGYRYRALFAGVYSFAHGDDMPGGISKESMVTEFCRQFGLPVHVEHPRLAIPAQADQEARAALKGVGVDVDRFVVIHPGPSWPVREWPSAKWGELVEKLKAAGVKHIVHLGVGKYLNFGKVEVNAIPGTASLVDKLTIEQSCAVIALAKLHIGIDSGLLHIAAAVGTPGVGLFGMTSPHTRFSPDYIRPFVVSDVECQGCYHRLPRVDWVTGCPNDIRCMKEMSVDVVLERCMALLDGGKSRLAAAE